MRIALVSATVAPVALIGGWTVAAALQRDFDQVSGTISALAAQDAAHRWVMTTALIGTGLAHLVTASALTAAGRPGRVVLGLGGLATLGVAAFPLPAQGGSTAHAIAAAVAFVALAIWPLLSIRGDGPRPFRPPVAVAASVVLLVGLVWFGVELAGGGDRVGLAERVAAGGQALWPLVAALTGTPARSGPP